jgi:hypothetical protein
MDFKLFAMAPPSRRIMDENYLKKIFRAGLSVSLQPIRLNSGQKMES